MGVGLAVLSVLVHAGRQAHLFGWWHLLIGLVRLWLLHVLRLRLGHAVLLPLQLLLLRRRVLRRVPLPLWRPLHSQRRSHSLIQREAKTTTRHLPSGSSS